MKKSVKYKWIKINIIIAFILLNPIFIYTQDNKLFIPLNIRSAYEKGTRHMSGKPGWRYWQNHAIYRLNAEVNPKKFEISGTGTITYFNESPYTLNRIIFKLFPNLYKKGSIRLELIDSVDITNGMNIKNLSMRGKGYNGITNDFNLEINGTIMTIDVPGKLAPNDSLSINLSWSYTLPKKTWLRQGAYDSTSFFVAYWYPMISVLDDISGWDIIDYNGRHEQYFDFNDFEISITAPKNFIIWSTGDILNYNEVLNEKIYEKYSMATQKDSIIHIVDSLDLSGKNITIDKESLTWKAKAKHVLDFSFAISDHYLWDATSIVVEHSPERKVIINAAYHPNSKSLYLAAEIGKESIQYLSDEMPGIPYPYNQMSIFNGSGGMEFPMMINIESRSPRPETVFLISHEITHAYFPFLTGLNQSKYSWMDEGLTMFVASDFQERTGKMQKKDANFYFNIISGDEFDMPLMTPTIYLTLHDEYFVTSYYKSEMAFLVLQNILGTKIFKLCLQEFIKRWQGKHPTPYDFFYTFEEVSKQELSWFWEAWYFKRGYADLSIKDVKVKNNKMRLIIERTGELPVPVYLKIIYDDQSFEEIEESAAYWKNPVKIYKFEKKTKKKITSIILGNQNIPDKNLSDNFFDLTK